MAGIDFTGADLTEVDLSGAYTLQANFAGVDLSGTRGLTQGQLEDACGDDATKLPAGLTKPATWPCAAEE